MKNKILIPVLIVAALAAFFSFRNEPDTPDRERQKLVLQTIMETIRTGHFSPKKLDDSFSYQAFHKVIDNLDYEKKFFTAADYNELKSFEYKMDEELDEGSLDFFDKIYSLFAKRIQEAEGYYKEILKTPFSFNTNEKVQLNGEKINFCEDETALKQRWSSYLKYRVLAKYVDLKTSQEKRIADKKKDDTAKIKTDAEMELAARESVRKNQEAYFKRLKKMKEDQLFALYVNSITGTEDPHTDYLPPVDKAKFDEMMSGKFFGIGAQLRDEEGKIKVVAILPGTPCWKQGELKTDDEIIKVAQGNAEPVDVQGFDIDDAIKLIRGDKGTEVRLTVRKMDGSIKVIPIIRGEVEREEIFAKSVLIESPKGSIGYIYLPEFYADFSDAQRGRRCAEDVRKEIIKLKGAGVFGIILDLRNNTGGSLNDVVDMAGLFVEQGPMVQVKSSGSKPQVLNDRDNSVLYDGPLAIMVNQNSASASEIMAAAMQDYKRAIIVGSPTYGKGTVQRVLSLDDLLGPAGQLAARAEGISLSEKPLGSLKMTMQKFYRINGGSTQLRGVYPDVVIPDIYEDIEIGERRDKAALKWDEIPPANYTPFSHPVPVKELAALSSKRISSNESFKIISQSADKLKANEQKTDYTLNEKEYRKEVEEANATSKKMEELEKKFTTLTIANVKEDMLKINMDSSSVAKNADWIKNLSKDIYLSETVNIVNDLINMGMHVDMGTGMK